MTRRITATILTAVSILVLAGTVMAQAPSRSAWAIEDSTPAFLVKYAGTGVTCTIKVMNDTLARLTVTEEVASTPPLAGSYTNGTSIGTSNAYYNSGVGYVVEYNKTINPTNWTITPIGGSSPQWGSSNGTLISTYTGIVAAITGQLIVASTADMTVRNLSLTDSGCENKFTFDTSLGVILTNLNLTTNAAGLKSVEVKQWAALASEMASNNILGFTNTFTLTNVWFGYAKWDTSVAKHFDVTGNYYLTPSSVGVPVFEQIGNPPYYISTVYGNPGGTGSSIIDVYSGNELLYEVPEATNFVAQNFGAGYNIDRGKVGWVRVKRSGTATAGGIGITVIDR